MELVKKPILEFFLKIAFMAGIVFSTPLSGLACGLNWMPPRGYFKGCDDQGYVLLTEELADLAIPGESETVPIWAFFSSEYTTPSPYAGMWRIGILDMSLVQISENQFRMRDPGGNENLLSWDKKQNALEGSGWKGSVSADRIKLWASCGWSVEFYRGKIAKMTTPHNKTLIYNYAEGCISSITCDGKALIALGGLKRDTVDITIGDKKLGIVKADQPRVQRVGNANVIKGMDKSLSEITEQGEAGRGRNFTYTVDEKKQPVIMIASKNQQPFALVWNAQTRKIVRYDDWEYTKIRDQKTRWDTIELSRKNSQGEVESYFRDIKGGVTIKQLGDSKRSEYRFTSGPAIGKVRKTEEKIKEKITNFQQYAYDEKGRMIRGQENEDKLLFVYDDKNYTVTAWKNDMVLWKKTMDEKERIVKVEYPDGKELRMAYPEKRPVTAELVWKGASIVVQLDSEGLIKIGTEVIRGVPIQ